MRTTRGTAFAEPASEYSMPLAAYLLFLVVLVSLAVLGGVWAFQPTITPNRGMAAYEAPPATHLIPLPHKMDAPVLAKLSPAAIEPEPTAEPPAAVVEKKPAVTKTKAARKRPKVRPQDEYRRGNAYADNHWGGAWGGGGRSWGGGWGGWNDRW